MPSSPDVDVRLRPLRDEDYPWLARLRSAAEDVKQPAEVVASWDSHWRRGEGSLLERNVAEVEGRPVSTSALRVGAFLPPHCGHVWIGTDPEFVGRGLGSLMYGTVEFRARELRLVGFRSMVRAEDERSLAIAVAHGFTVYRTRVEQHLDLRALSGEPAQVPAGLRVVTLEEADSPELRQALYALMREGEQDIPAIDGEGPPFEQWEAAWMDPELHPRDAFWLALADGEPVGMVVYEAPLAPGAAASLDYTGVRRSWRGRGMGRALKDLSHRELARRGLVAVHTHNDLDNPGVMALNRNLGYQVVRSVHMVHKDL